MKKGIFSIFFIHSSTAFVVRVLLLLPLLPLLLLSLPTPPLPVLIATTSEGLGGIKDRIYTKLQDRVQHIVGDQNVFVLSFFGSGN